MFLQIFLLKINHKKKNINIKYYYKDTRIQKLDNIIKFIKIYLN